MILVDYPGHLVALGFLVLTGALLVFTYRSERARQARGWQWILGAIRYASIVILLVIIWNPSRTVTTETSARSTALAIFDTSESMSIEDCNGKSRLDEAIRLFQESFAPGNPDRPRYRIYGFDSACYECGSLGSLHRWGRRTNLHAAATLLKRADAADANAVGSSGAAMEDRQVIGGIVFTDGQADDKEINSYLPPADRGPRLAFVGVGSPEMRNDVAITSVRAPARAAIDTVYEVTVSVKAKCSNDGTATITLLKNDSAIDVKQVSVGGRGFSGTVPFLVAADALGQHCIKVRADLSESEMNLANNVRRTMIQVVEWPDLKVLFYSEVASFDIGKIRSALARDEKVQLDMALHAIKPASLSEKAAAACDYVELPQDRAGFCNYDVVILGPSIMDQLSATRVDGLYSFVADRGGGLILLPGRDECDIARCTNSTIRQLLPVEFLGKTQDRLVGRKDALQLTVEGFEQHLLSETDLKAFRAVASPYYGGLSKKPAAAALATSGSATIVCVHRVGRGRVCLLNIYGLFRWYREDLNGGLLQKFVSGLTAYMGRITSREAGIELFVERSAEEPRAVVFDAYVYDEDYSRVPDANVLLHFEDGVIRMDQKEKGHYAARVENVLNEAVVAHCEAELNGVFLGHRALAANLPLPRTEMDSVELDREFLQDLAHRMGGQYLDAADVDRGTADMFAATSKAAESHMASIWACWPLLMILCALLSVSWFLRRSVGLA